MEQQRSSTRAWLVAGLVVAVAAALPLQGCGESGGDSADTRPCDPLATMMAAVTLSNVLGVGQGPDGTTYVVDQPEGGEYRLFVSEGTTLRRRDVRGSGVVADGDTTLIVVNSGTASEQINVELATDAAGNLRMGLVRGALPDRQRTFAIGELGEVLEVVPASTLSALTLENLPGSVVVEYLATLADGRQLLVTRPEVDASYEDFRLFLGSADRLIERRVSNVGRGSFTIIAFELDGAEAEATFGSPLAADPTSRLVVGGETFELSVETQAEPPAGAAYVCL